METKLQHQNESDLHEKNLFNYQYIDIVNFINVMDVMDNWDDGIENTFTKFADETKLGVWWTCQKGKQS